MSSLPTLLISKQSQLICRTHGINTIAQHARERASGEFSGVCKLGNLFRSLSRTGLATLGAGRGSARHR